MSSIHFYWIQFMDLPTRAWALLFTVFGYWWNSGRLWVFPLLLILEEVQKCRQPGWTVGGVHNTSQKFGEVYALWGNEVRKPEELADKSCSLRHSLVWNTIYITEHQAVIYFCKAVVNLEKHHLVCAFPLSLLPFFTHSCHPWIAVSKNSLACECCFKFCFLEDIYNIALFSI